MRIALVTSQLPADTGGGAEGYAVDLARALQTEHDVLVITGSTASAEAVPVARVPGPRPFRPDGAATHKAAWHLADQWRPSVHLQLGRILKRFSPAVVHTHNPQGLSAAVFTAIAQQRIRHVHTAHDLNILCVRASMTRDGDPCSRHCPSCLPQRLIRGRAVRSHLHTLIAPSDYVRRRHVEAGVVTEERSVAIPQGAAPGRVRERGTRAGPRFGYIGTLAAHKGVQTLLRALPDGDDARIVIAGEGPLRRFVEERAAQDPRVDYLGRVSGGEKEDFFDRLDVLVIPSEWEENAPLVAIEAAVRGIPCIVSDRGGLPETPHAWISPAGDAGRLRALMTRLGAASDEVRSRSAALLLERERYLWSRHVGRVQDVLARAAAEGEKVP